MSKNLYPILFNHIYKHHIWGGNRIPALFGRQPQKGTCAESWEVSDRSDGMSMVRNGPYAGKSLHELVEALGVDLVGAACTAKVFPVLVKLIDAKERLSIQVHPGDRAAAAHGGEPKTEMWYVLDALPNAMMFSGLADGVTRESFEKAVRDNKVADCIRSYPAKKGDVFFIPGGTIHATGEGTLLLEVQQNSDTTYRIYDWGRLGRDGKPRDLHVSQALRVVDWENKTAAKVPSYLARKKGLNSWWEIVRCPYFHVTRLELAEPEPVSNDGRSFHILFVPAGNVGIEGGGIKERLPSGTSCLVPAGLKNYTLSPDQEKATLIHMSLV